MGASSPLPLSVPGFKIFRSFRKSFMSTLRAEVAPVAKEENKEITMHGRTRVDSFQWLKDDNWQQVLREPHVLRADIREHLDKENTYTESILAPTKKLQAKLFQEMKGRISEVDSSVPSLDGPYAYYSRYATGNEHPIIARIDRGDVDSWSPEGTAPSSYKEILDANKLAEGKEFFKLGGVEQSPDHKIIAYSVDVKGSEYFDIRFRDAQTGAQLPDVLVNCSSSFVWAADSNQMIYTIIDDNHREKFVYRHVLGTEQDKDPLIYEEEDDGFFLGVGKTESERYIVLASNDHSTSEVRLLDAKNPQLPPVLVQKRIEGVLYEVSDHGDALLILTNHGGATDFKIVQTPLDRLGVENWKDLVAHKAGTLISGMTNSNGLIVRSEKVNALPRLVVSQSECAAAGAAVAISSEFVIEFEEEAYSLGMSGFDEFSSKTLRFSYSSPTTPTSEIDYDCTTRERIVRKTQKLPSGHNPADYVCRRLMVPSHDGAKVPVTVLARRDTCLTDGSAPLVLYGYGSYGSSMPASFSTSRLSLVDRGVVYAVSHVRGGADCGYEWYDPNGKTVNKKNTFLDFIASAEYLVDKGFTSDGKICISGGSAGGMLVGATMNMARQGLLCSVVGEVPFVDVLNTMCDVSLPLTPPEWPEWGNPIEDEEAYKYIESYSPYDALSERKYPAVLATAGLTDPRVTYWEPAKWIAKLRKVRTDKEGVSLLHTNMGAGHAGKSGRFDRLEEVALVHGFVLYMFQKTGSLPELDL